MSKTASNEGLLSVTPLADWTYGHYLLVQVGNICIWIQNPDGCRVLPTVLAGTPVTFTSPVTGEIKQTLACPLFIHRHNV